MTEQAQSLHEQLVTALAEPTDAALSAALASARAADIAQSFQLLGDEDRSRIIFSLPPATAAEVVVLLDEATRSEVVDELDTPTLTEIVSELAPDDAADVLGEMTDEEADQILDQLVEAQSDKIEELLEFDESTAGGIMTPDIVAVVASRTVADAVEEVRRATPHEDLNEVFIVDDQHRLLGTVPLRRLVTSPATMRLAELVQPVDVAVHAADDQESVLQTIRNTGAMTAAVLDDQERLIGRITLDDVLDVAEEEAQEDLLRMAGTDASELATTSLVHAARVRLTWLLPCMLGMCLSATVLGLSKAHFNVALFATLTMFVPMIGATGGNSGIQISTVIIRGFAAGELATSRLWHVVFREGRIALAMAPICGLVAWVAVTLGLPLIEHFMPSGESMPATARVAFAVGWAMTSAILVAAALGILLPFGFRRLGVDPAIASGPLVTTMNDVVSVSIYMTIALLVAR